MSNKKIAESLYETSVGRIKVLEKQAEILASKLSLASGKLCVKRNCITSRDCSMCWREWSLKQAEKELSHEQAI